LKKNEQLKKKTCNFIPTILSAQVPSNKKVGALRLHKEQNFTSAKGIQGVYVSYRKSCTGDYRYGFNGQEKVDEIAGVGNHNTALFWEYDTRLGRRWNVDPVDQVGVSNYACFGNNPIAYNDKDGDVVNLIAGAIGAGLGAGFSIAGSLIKNHGKMTNADWGKAAVAAGAGGLAGLTLGGSLAVTVTVGFVASSGQSVANDIIDKRPVSVKKALLNGSVGMVTSFVGGAIVSPTAVIKGSAGIFGNIVKTNVPFTSVLGIAKNMFPATGGAMKYLGGKALSIPRQEFGGLVNNTSHLAHCYKCIDGRYKVLFKIGKVEFDW
jgi:RHS repeat-associated protein